MNPMINYKLKTSTTHIYHLGIENGINGAVAPFYPGVLDRICDVLKDDIYISFTSSRECAVHPVSKISSSAVKRIARKQFDTPMFLDDSVDNLTPDVYCYERVTKKLRKI